MKKLLTTLLCGLLLTSALLMSACDSNDQPNDTDAATDVVTETPTEAPTEAPTEPAETDADGNELFATLNEKTPLQLIESLEAYFGKNYGSLNELKMTMKMNMDGMNMSVDMEEEIIVKRNGNDAYTKTEGSDGMGSTTVTELWYVDGMIYTEEYDESLNPVKVRYPVTPENVTEGGWMDLEDDVLMATPEAWLKDAKFAKIDDMYVVSVAADADMIKASAEELELDELSEGAEVSSLIQTYYFNADGSLAYVTYNIDMAMEGMACVMENKLTVTGVGKTEVKAPANADQYELLE